MLEGAEVKRQEVYRVADTLFKRNADWVKFFREVLGVEGAMRRPPDCTIFRHSSYSRLPTRSRPPRPNQRAPGGSDWRAVPMAVSGGLWPAKPHRRRACPD